MILGINHIALSVSDFERTVSFYGGVLGFRKVEQMGWAADSRMSAIAGRIIGVHDTAARAAHLRGLHLLIDHGITHFCLAVQDLDAEYARLHAAGVRFLSEPVTPSSLPRAEPPSPLFLPPIGRETLAPINAP